MDLYSQLWWFTVTEWNVTLTVSFLWARTMSALLTISGSTLQAFHQYLWMKSQYIKLKTENMEVNLHLVSEIRVLFSRFILGNYSLFRITTASLLFFFFNTLVKIRARCVLLETSWRCEMQNTPNMQSDHRCQLMLSSDPWGSEPVPSGSPNSCYRHLTGTLRSPATCEV